RLALELGVRDRVRLDDRAVGLELVEVARVVLDRVDGQEQRDRDVGGLEQLARLGHLGPAVVDGEERDLLRGGDVGQPGRRRAGRQGDRLGRRRGREVRDALEVVVRDRRRRTLGRGAVVGLPAGVRRDEVRRRRRRTATGEQQQGGQQQNRGGQARHGPDDSRASLPVPRGEPA